MEAAFVAPTVSPCLPSQTSASAIAAPLCASRLAFSHKRAANTVAPAVAVAAGIFAAGKLVGAKADARGRRRAKLTRAGFGPIPYDTKQREDAIQDDVGQRVNYVVRDNAKSLQQQLDQYGYAQIDGFLGGSILGLPMTMRNEMDKLFAKGWFEEEPEQDRQFKVGGYKITNQDSEHRFRLRLVGNQGDADAERRVESQYEVAPTTVNFIRSLLVSLAGPIAKVAKGSFSTNVGLAEIFALCGNGARFDRRVGNVHGWRTPQGYAPDNRKLTVMYFTNPNWREELGGHLQLEGVKTPTGRVSLAPVNDRLVMFWSDRTVWSMRSSRAHTMSEHQFGIMLQLMAESRDTIDYDPKRFAEWFPELNGLPIEWPPKGVAPMSI